MGFNNQRFPQRHSFELQENLFCIVHLYKLTTIIDPGLCTCVSATKNGSLLRLKHPGLLPGPLLPSVRRAQCLRAWRRGQWRGGGRLPSFQISGRSHCHWHQWWRCHHHRGRDDRCRGGVPFFRASLPELVGHLVLFHIALHTHVVAEWSIFLISFEICLSDLSPVIMTIYLTWNCFDLSKSFTMKMFDPPLLWNPSRKHHTWRAALWCGSSCGSQVQSCTRTL